MEENELEPIVNKYGSFLDYCIVSGIDHLDIIAMSLDQENDLYNDSLFEQYINDNYKDLSTKVDAFLTSAVANKIVLAELSKL